MKINLKHLRGLFLLYTLLLIIYTGMRVVFVLYNKADFDTSSDYALGMTFLSGSRFDLSSILLSNILFSLLWILPFGKFWASKAYQIVLKIIFLVSNGLFITLNAIDIVYFPFVKKRMQRDALLFFNGDKGQEAYTLLPSFIMEYWFVWLFMVGCIFLLIRYYGKIVSSLKGIPYKFSFAYLGVFPLIIGLELLGMRGGLQLRPLAVIDASQSTGVKNIPFVLNSTFSMLRTWGKKSLEEKHYFKDSEFTKCDLPVKNIESRSDSSMQRMNVVIIMVESLSKEYLSYYQGTGRTPFLDSLMNHGLVFNNGYANARESVQGVPAVMASIPAWMDEPFIFSKYASNSFNSLASVSRPYGYKSYFFHGATRGSMGFYSFTNLAGFDGYFGREDYPDPTHFDGSWGIWDHHFLPYMVDKLSSIEQPFIASVLTLNTHHPFEVPKDFHVVNPNAKYPILNSLQYTDHCLQAFFEYAEQQPWYNNTLFVLTADHTGPMTVDSKSSLEEYSIPIVFYKPDNSLTGTSEVVINQIDIMPTVLSMIGVNQKVFCFGQDVLDTSCGHSHMSYKSGIYQYADESHCLLFDGMKTIGLFNWKMDHLQQHNLMNDPTMQGLIHTMETQIKKSIQSYNGALIHNKMLPNETD